MRSEKMHFLYFVKAFKLLICEIQFELTLLQEFLLMEYCGLF